MVCKSKTHHRYKHPVVTPAGEVVGYISKAGEVVIVKLPEGGNK